MFACVRVYGTKEQETRGSATADIARVSGHYAVQSHSRSPISVPISITSYLIPFPIYRTVLVVFSIWRGYFSWTRSFSVMSMKITMNHTLEIRKI